MIELGNTAPEKPAEGLIRDVTDQSFMEDVIEASREVPVIVDFWAPWCGPCKTLGPALEQAVNAARGAVRMAKVNVDENQMVAGQLRVQSIPTVYAFFQGQPVDGFQGAVAPSEVKAFVERLAKMAGGDGIEEALEAAETMLAEGALQDAAQTFAAIMAEVPDNGRAIGGLARALLAAGNTDEAKATLDRAPAELQKDAAILAARSAIELAEMTQETGEVAELRARLEADPSDHQARYDLALALIAARDNEGAIDALLDLFRRDREWNDGAARTQLFKLFDTLGPKDPLTQKGRRRLSSMIFA
ncbi:co-chaperone YbbN [Limibaculum sp. M0105]|uniref:Co-chaperone YbbN n=1 Tax=Thermohalobaculum xanthum TaxID=2753746 RepID=A0A8J7M9P1_9RHOB|nr:co-chaperone YbbN [Thermohalobaculum xanthum]MBK0400733.1 co-chaperone YbbN [Thermohalobaculum xanthum]